MIDSEKLQLFGLTSNQSKVIEFFIKNRTRKDLNFRKIRTEIKSPKSFYREILLDLIDKKFLYVIRDKRPITYQLNEDRFEEIFQEYKNLYEKNQHKYDLILQKMTKLEFKNQLKSQDILKFLEKIKVELRLNEEQISIINILLSQKEDANSLTPITLNQIAKKLGKKNDITNIRYNLSLLEKRGFIFRRKIGRSNYFGSKTLMEIIEREKKYQEQTWIEKEEQMLAVIHFLEKYPKKLVRRDEHYDLKNNLSDIKNTIIKLIEGVQNEIIVDIRCGYERIDSIKIFLQEIFKKLLELILNKNHVKVKILLNIDDWLVHKLDFVFLQLITRIKTDNFEIRVPINEEQREFRIIGDNSIMFQILGVDTLSEDENGIKINNKRNIDQINDQFNRIWENSLDLRDAIFDYKIDKEIEKAIKKSEKKYPPEYNFKDKFLVIGGLQKGIRVLLRLYAKARNEICTILGPLFPSKSGVLSAVESLKQNKFYERINKVVSKKAKANLNIRWIRNTDATPHLQIYKNDDLKRYMIDFGLSLYPNFQMRQLSLEQYQFSIIDKKILVILEFSKQVMTISQDEFIIDEYNFIFEKAWSEAYDIRLQWLSEVSKKLGKYIENTFYQINLQISMPKEGEIKRFEGKFARPILYSLLNNLMQDIHKIHTIFLFFTNDLEDISIDMICDDDFLNVSRALKVPTKIIINYFPQLKEIVSCRNLKTVIEIFPSCEFRLLPKNIQTYNFFGLFNEYIVNVEGKTNSDNYHIFIINNRNLRKYFLDQFNSLWDKSVDIRQFFYEYGKSETKNLVLDSIKKFGFEKKLNSDEIRELFP
ncbi:MAG: hypothetical protein ACTSR3_05980 [Candidatus Helarchaeota archaeon]